VWYNSEWKQLRAMTRREGAAISLGKETSVERTVELFCGEQKAFSCIAQSLGFSVFTVDINPSCTPELVADVRTLRAEALPASPLIVWAAPPDTGIEPVDGAGEEAITVFRATMNAIALMKPKWWFIENPKGILRTLPVVAGFNRGYPSRNRHTIRHDEYGGRNDTETDVWTNAYWWIPRPGERDGREGIETGRRVPPTVFAEIFAQLDMYRSTGFYGPR
jgi:hypothetical protein